MTATMTTLFTAIGIPALGGAVDGLVDSMDGVHKAAAQASIDAFKKIGGGASELGKIETRLKQYDEKITKAAEVYNKLIDDAGTGAAKITEKHASDMSDEQIANALAGAIAQKQIELDDTKAKQPITTAEKALNALKKSTLEQEIADLKRTREGWEKAQKDLDELKRKKKEQESKDTPPKGA
jgi:hypothetical protein